MKSIKDLIRQKATQTIKKEVKKTVEPVISHILPALETIGVLAACYGSFCSARIAPEPSKTVVFVLNNYYFK